MKLPKITEGELYIRKSDYSADEFSVWIKHTSHNALFSGSHTEADAQLISASKDILKALVDAYNEIRDIAKTFRGAMDGAFDHTADSCEEWAEEIKVVLEKAGVTEL